MSKRRQVVVKFFESREGKKSHTEGAPGCSLDPRKFWFRWHVVPKKTLLTERIPLQTGLSQHQCPHHAQSLAGLILLGSMVLVQSQEWQLGSVNNAPSPQPGLSKALSLTHPCITDDNCFLAFIINGWEILSVKINPRCKSGLPRVDRIKGFLVWEENTV